jgi:hypothetical protein
MTMLPPRRAAAVATGLAALTLAGLLDPLSPRPLGEDAPGERFSAARAWPALEFVAAVPHPLGSPRQAAVRAFLERELERLDVAWEARPWTRLHGGVPRQGVNLLARLPARDAEASRILFLAHYDSHPEAPGAGDDGAAVAAMLECLRALSPEGPRRNALEFLLTDGEEAGLLGAAAFVDTPGALEGLACVINFEGRGNHGPAILFETGRDDRAWIAAYAACAPRPLGTSLGPAVYERLPNDTDFTLFQQRGVPGLNFAWVGGGSAYHRPADAPANLDRRALQHHGETMLALARHLGDADVEALAAQRGRATYFTLPGNLMVHYAQGLDLPIGALALLAVLASLGAAVRAGRCSLAGLALGLLATPVVVALAACALSGVSQAARGLVTALIAEPELAHGNGPSSTWLLVGLVFAGCAAASLAARTLGPRTRLGLAGGALLLWAVLTCLTSLRVPGAGHAFAWPTAAAALTFAAVGRAATPGDDAPPAGPLALAGAVAFLLLGLTVLRLLHQVGSVEPWRGIVLASVLIGLAVPLALPLFAWLGTARGRRSSAILVASALVPLLAGAVLEALGR